MNLPRWQDIDQTQVEHPELTKFQDQEEDNRPQDKGYQPQHLICYLL